MAIPSTLSLYLNQYVKIASGDRVKLSGGVALSGASVSINTGYFVFNCEECKDNWHVGHENFYGNIADPGHETIPSVLSDWVKKHRHICKKFTNPTATSTGVCQSCKWPYGAHEESWAGQQVFNEQGKPLASGMALGVYQWPKPVDTSMTLKQYTGRKFRDAEETLLCELPDTATDKTSKG